MRLRRLRQCLLWGLSLACMPLEASPTLKQWIGANLPPGEKVLCERELRGEYFFVARAGDEDRLRLGSRVDLSGLTLETLSLGVSWRLRDENDRPLTPKIAPTRVRDVLLHGGGKTYAENIHLQTINVGSPAKHLRARALIVKCPEHPCPQGSPRARRYAVRVCDVAL